MIRILKVKGNDRFLEIVEDVRECVQILFDKLNIEDKNQFLRSYSNPK